MHMSLLHVLNQQQNFAYPPFMLAHMSTVTQLLCVCVCLFSRR